jgi:hypothetical protein
MCASGRVRNFAILCDQTQLALLRRELSPKSFFTSGDTGALTIRLEFDQVESAGIPIGLIF